MSFAWLVQKLLVFFWKKIFLSKLLFGAPEFAVQTAAPIHRAAKIVEKRLWRPDSAANHAQFIAMNWKYVRCRPIHSYELEIGPLNSYQFYIVFY